MNHRSAVVFGLAIATIVPAIPAAVPVASAVSCTVTTVVSPGQTSAAVLCVEQRLVELGYTGVGAPDTFFGSATTTAVKAFQASRGLYPDGVVRSLTSRQLGLRGIGAPALNPVRATLIGDSTMAAMRWYDEANNVTTRYDTVGNAYDLILSAESCRRLVATSCTGRTDPSTGFKWVPQSVLPLMQGALRGQLGQALVIMAGYDDWSISSAIEQIMAEAKAQGVVRVYWLNYRLTSSYAAYQGNYANFNAQLLAARVRHPNLVVLDWNGYSAGQSGWFASDGIHMTATGATALGSFITSNLDSYYFARCLAANANTGQPDPTTGTPTAPATGDTGFVALPPRRLLDTRYPDQGGGNGRVGAGRTVGIDVSGVVPAGTEAVTLSVTAVDPCRAGYLTVFGCGTRPGTSNLNYATARTSATMAISLVTDGRVCVHSSSTTDLVVDITGAFTGDGSRFTPSGPTRWVDTRGNPAVLPITGLQVAGADVEVQVAGAGGVPADANAAWINLTAANAPYNTVLTAYPGPCGAPPLSSNVNVLAGRSASAAVLVGLGPSGSLCIRTAAGATHVVVDLAGWFSPSGTLAYRGVAPSRLYDSRPGAAPPAGSVHQVPLTDASVLGIVSVGSTGFGYVAAEPCGSAATSSVLNTAPNEPVANVAAVGPGASTAACLSASVATDVVVDRVGEFVPGT